MIGRVTTLECVRQPAARFKAGPANIRVNEDTRSSRTQLPGRRVGGGHPRSPVDCTPFFRVVRHKRSAGSGGSVERRGLLGGRARQRRADVQEGTA